MMRDDNQNSNTNSINHCVHCNTVIGKISIYDKDADKYFCCNGCKTVYNLINSEGLSTYYSTRTVSNIKPFENIDISSDYFTKSIKNLPDGNLELSLIINNIHCASCIWLIERYFRSSAVKSIAINYSNHKAKIIFSPLDISIKEVLGKITSLGYYPLPSTQSKSAADIERRDYFYRFATASFFTMQLMLYSAALYSGYFLGIDEEIKNFFQYISLLLTTPVIFYSAYPFFKNSIISAKHRHWTMDTLVALGAGSAYLYSVVAIFLGYEIYFDTAAMIVTLILLGRFIEAGAKQRGGEAVSKLLALQPLVVKRVNDINQLENLTLTNIEEMQIGDLFLIEKGLTVALDGKVVLGESEIDESMLTGEPVSISRSVGDEVYAGSRNISTDIVAKVLRVGENTFISKIAAAVDDAESSKAAIQNFADRFISKFVPTVIIISILTFIFHTIFLDNNISYNIMRAVSVLVIACPCAMGLAIPLAIINSISKLMSIGIIFKGGEAIERMSMVNDIYFDKTGTLTMSKMKVVDKFIIDSFSIDKTVLESIGKISSKSLHPVSKAIAQYTLTSNDYLIDNIDILEYAGKGVSAEYNNQSYLIGNDRLMREYDVDDNKLVEEHADKFKRSGKTIVLVAIDKKIVAVFAISDTIRAESKTIIDQLKLAGNSVTLLTGDNHLSASSMMISNDIDIPIYSDISPFEKAEIISKSKDITKTAMIGDGINDAIALTTASVGISMRNSTDISMASASAVLLRNDLSILVSTQKIAKKTMRIMKENLFWSFLYNIIAIPLAVTGYIHPVMSAVFMSVSSLVVIINSTRIKR